MIIVSEVEEKKTGVGPSCSGLGLALGLGLARPDPKPEEGKVCYYNHNLIFQNWSFAAPEAPKTFENLNIDDWKL